MYLNSSQTKSLSKVFEVLTQPDNNFEMRQQLLDPLCRLLNADYIASFRWDAKMKRFCEGVSTRRSPEIIAAYEEKFQFEDPIPNLLRTRRCPTLVTEVIPQKQLVRSNFFNTFLRGEPMYWGVNLFAHNGQQDVGDLRIWRSQEKGNYEKEEMNALTLLYPSLVNALSGAQKLTSELREDGHPQEKFKRSLAEQHGLSRREYQVSMLVAQGFSDKEIAKSIGIGFTSVRTYLTQAFKKTNCANRKELIAYLCSRKDGATGRVVD